MYVYYTVPITCELLKKNLKYRGIIVSKFIKKIVLNEHARLILSDSDPTRFHLKDSEGDTLALIGLDGSWWGTSYNNWTQQGKEQGFCSYDTPDMIRAICDAASFVGLLKSFHLEDV